MLGQEKQILRVELELATHLVPELVDTVEPLQEALRAVFHVLGGVVSQPLMEHVTEAEPVLGDQSGEALKGPEPRVDHELDQSTQLTGAIPAI